MKVWVVPIRRSPSWLNAEQKAALRRHGYPDLIPNGMPRPDRPDLEIKGYAEDPAGKSVPTMLRSYVCALDGIEIDGHQTDWELDPGSTHCMHCGRPADEFDEDDA